MKFVKLGSSDTPGYKYVWVVDGSLKAVYTSNYIDLNTDADADTVNKLRKEWDNHLDRYNQGAVVTAKGAFHVSQTWAETDANAELIMSAVLTLVILLVLAFSFMVLFTWSI